jgi:hypothetical protein
MFTSVHEYNIWSVFNFSLRGKPLSGPRFGAVVTAPLASQKLDDAEEKGVASPVEDTSKTPES